MNIEFYTNLTRMKNMNNATQLEAVKQMYLLSDEIENPCPDCGYLDQCCDGDCETQIGKIERPNSRTLVIPTSKGTLRITLADQDNAVVEVSPCGTPEMYQVAGIMPTSTGVKEAIKMAEDALADDEKMEGVFESMKNTAAGLALAAAGSLATGCAGGPHYGAELDPTINEEPAPKEIVVEPGQNLSNQDFVDLVSNYSYKIRHDDSTLNSLVNNGEFATGESAQEANKVYNMLKNGSVKVGSYSPEASANKFKEAIDKELSGKLGINHGSFFKEEVN